MKLTNPTDDELNAAFAEYVAGWHRWRGAGGVPLDSWHDADKDRGKARFTTSADAVLPWLSKWLRVDVVKCGTGDAWNVAILPTSTVVHEAKSTFPRAAVLALLRAHNVEIEFTHE